MVSRRALQAAESTVRVIRSQAERVVACEDPTGRAAAQRLQRLLADADRLLGERLRRVMVATGGQDVRFSAAQASMYREQVRLTAEYVRQRLAGMTDEQAQAAIASSLGHTVDSIARMEEAFTGIAQPLRLRQALVFDNVARGVRSSLLRQHLTSVDRYGDAMIGEIEQTMATGMVAGFTQWDMVNALTGHGGPAGTVSMRARVVNGSVERLSEEEIPEGLFTRYRSWAWRIVRTETSHAYNEARLAGLIEMRAEMPDLAKKILATFDQRTAYDSIVVHGQIRPLDGLFTDGLGRQYQRPPGRPNDREVMIPWRSSWPETPSTAPLTPAQVGFLQRRLGTPMVSGVMRDHDVAEERRLLGETRRARQRAQAAERRRARAEGLVVQEIEPPQEPHSETEADRNVRREVRRTRRATVTPEERTRRMAALEETRQQYAGIQAQIDDHDRSGRGRSPERDALVDALNAAREREARAALSAYEGHPEFDTPLLQRARKVVSWLDASGTTMRDDHALLLWSDVHDYTRAIGQAGTMGERARSARSGFKLSMVRSLERQMQAAPRVVTPPVVTPSVVSPPVVPPAPPRGPTREERAAEQERERRRRARFDQEASDALRVTRDGAIEWHGDRLGEIESVGRKHVGLLRFEDRNDPLSRSGYRFVRGPAMSSRRAAAEWVARQRWDAEEEVRAARPAPPDPAGLRRSRLESVGLGHLAGPQRPAFASREEAIGYLRAVYRAEAVTVAGEAEVALSDLSLVADRLDTLPGHQMEHLYARGASVRVMPRDVGVGRDPTWGGSTQTFDGRPWVNVEGSYSSRDDTVRIEPGRAARELMSADRTDVIAHEVGHAVSQQQGFRMSSTVEFQRVLAQEGGRDALRQHAGWYVSDATTASVEESWAEGWALSNSERGRQWLERNSPELLRYYDRVRETFERQLRPEMSGWSVTSGVLTTRQEFESQERARTLQTMIGRSETAEVDRILARRFPRPPPASP